MDLNRVQYLTERDVSQMICRALSTLRNDRHAGRGIPYVKFSKSVRYRLSDVEEYMEANRVETRQV